MALIELLMAMVVLNIGIFALIATFQSGSMALRRAALVSNGSAVGDKVMETYRGLQNKAIFLSAPAGGGNDVSGMPNGIPNSTSTYAPIPASSAANVPAGLAIDPTKAVQKVTGPDGQSYPVYTYIIMVQPSTSYGYLKQVTVMVFDPLNTTHVISSQSSLFDPNVAP